MSTMDILSICRDLIEGRNGCAEHTQISTPAEL